MDSTREGEDEYDAEPEDVSDVGAVETSVDGLDTTKKNNAKSIEKMPPVVKKIPANKFKKAPQAPRRFKSAFIFFSTEKHKQIRSQMGDQGLGEKTTNIAKLVSEAWRDLDPEEREKWETMARRDKARYEVEKSTYKGPWRVPANKRTPKDPAAPKRPMSAFLAFSNKRRGSVKQSNPGLSNAEISKKLSQMWKEAPQNVRQKYIDEELSKRNEYKASMINWRKKDDEEKRVKRQLREELALQAADETELENMHARNEGDLLNHLTGSEMDASALASYPAYDESSFLPMLQSLQTSRAGLSMYGDGSHFVSSLIAAPGSAFAASSMGSHLSHLVDTPRHHAHLAALQQMPYQQQMQGVGSYFAPPFNMTSSVHLSSLLNRFGPLGLAAHTNVDQSDDPDWNASHSGNQEQRNAFGLGPFPPGWNYPGNL